MQISPPSHSSSDSPRSRPRARRASNFSSVAVSSYEVLDLRWLIKNQESVAHGSSLFGFFFSPYRIFDQVFDPTCHQPTPQQKAR
ncbi:hypothetical protein Pyn_33689 [Prunus yedoensis var. nudiflora]|uniref:Uncharacterized protein n=1 Tax=Prunus yedoensis var. nudiflora TaxID=2094558 RepID=A0A314XNL5_PRUYE|nr:hypothetical protein Pyn_33689 [Prunus yedoensis var. nudiflora]